MGDAMVDTQQAPVLQVSNLRKRYPNGVEAVKDISLELVPGEVFGLVGPNGAGKSTLLKLIAGLLRPEAGEIRVLGNPVTGEPSLAARWVGLMPDPLGVYTDISCREYLKFFGKVYGLEGEEFERRVDDTVKLLELGPWLDAEVETLSAGWQRRLALGRILLLDVPLLLLDEPAAGLDVKARSELLAIVRRLAGRGRTVVISSHILPELEELADRFAVMDQGRWVDILPGRTIVTREELHGGLGKNKWRLGCGSPSRAKDLLSGEGVEDIQETADGVVFTAKDRETAAAALARVAAAGLPVYEFKRTDDNLTHVVLDVLEKGEAV